MKLAARAERLKPSATLAITAKAKALKAEGKDIVGFGAGEPDFDTPENIKEAAIKAIRSGQTKYTPVGGINELKDAIIGKFRQDNDLAYSRDEIIVSCGGKHSIFNLFQAILNPGDEVIIPAPYWVSYPVMVSLGGGMPRIVHTTEAEGFRMSPEAFKRHLSPNTKAVVINSPSNPTGAAYTEKELARLAEIALENGLLIISDEIYEKLTYDGFKATSIESISDEVKKRTIVLNGVSKTYSMTGWRIGYAAGPKEIIKAMTNIQSQSTSNPTSISQWAAVEAISGPQDAIVVMVKEFDRRRRFLVEELNAIPGMSCLTPTGAFYVFPNTSRFYGKYIDGRNIGSSLDLVLYLLEEAKVALVHGEAFGDDDYIRLSYAASINEIRKGVERIREAVLRLK